MCAFHPKGFVKMIVDAYFEKRWAWCVAAPMLNQVCSICPITCPTSPPWLFLCKPCRPHPPTANPTCRYPIEPLQMEIMANGGSTTHPADVAEMARLVYCTLELAAPQFPR